MSSFSNQETNTLLAACLKPEEINGTKLEQIARVQELISWFIRLANDRANPKWTKAHAMELAYYLAKNNTELEIDLTPVTEKAFIEGFKISDSEREIFIRRNFLGLGETK